MKSWSFWKAFCIETAIYAVFLVIYFALVLHFLGDWFKHLYDHDRRLFAIMALVVMIGQTVGLELVNGGLFWLLRGKRK